MSAYSSGPTVVARAAPRRSVWRIYRLEARYELSKLLRLPAFAVPTLLFPALFYAFFGLAFGGGRSAGPVPLATHLMATYGAFGVIGASLFGFGVGVAVERGQGWMLLKRASPMPPGAYFFAKTAIAGLFGAAVLVELYALGAVLGGVRLAPAQWAVLATVHLAGSLPFCAMGLALGYWAGPNSAPAVVNLVYLPMAFLSGLWIPIEALPEWVRSIAPALPAYHYAQLALRAIGAAGRASPWIHGAYLAVFSAAALLAARAGFRRDGDATYG